MIVRIKIRLKWDGENPEPFRESVPSTLDTPRLDAPTFQSYTDTKNLVSMLLMAEHEAAYQ